MTEYLYPDFLSNRSDYESSAALWKSTLSPLFASDSSDISAPGFLELPELLEAQPIFGRVCLLHRRMVQIHQVEPNSDHLGFSAWIGDMEFDGHSVKILLVHCKLTKSALAKVDTLCRVFLDESVDSAVKLAEEMSG